jgi:hypothetical protein
MPTTMWEYISRSTMKREIATVFLMWWIAVGTYLLARTPVTQIVPDAALSTWAGLGVIVVGFATAAFGADWLSKQTTIAGPPMNTEIKTETTVSEGSAISTTSSTPVDPAFVAVPETPPEPKV